MGLERRWLQTPVSIAVAICLLCVSQGLSSLVRARVGSSAELGCSLTPTSKEGTTSNLFPLHVVEWVRLGYNVPILIKFGVYAPRVHPNYKGRVSLTQGASLLVERVSLADEGWFECRILLLDSKTDDFRNGTWTFLSITAPPVFIKTPPSFVEVLLGDSLTLSCGAHGNPRPTVVWHKDDTPIEKHEKIKVLNGTLSLASVTRNTSGVYKCHVSNSEGNLTHSMQLQVKGPPIIIVSPEDTTLNMSQDAVLLCQADAYPSNLTYEWLKYGQNVYHIESLKSRVKILVDGTLLIPNLIPEDAGNYTCVPTNGILTPPTASAHLKVKHPARVSRMPRETYLPAGMEGFIVCPVQADPPVLYVNWTKDGDHLNLNQFPGWMVNLEGSVFIATANDNAVGVYTCTAYNSYGTMGQSEPTRVILKDPPLITVSPRPEYFQEVGRELMIPCEASGDPSPNITWSKIGPIPRSPYSVLDNGSLLLQPLSKDHHGGWECLASNRVATVSRGTVVMVLGTSPHAVASVSVTTEMNQANVSWVSGFDGGFTQKFTVWVKQASRGKHEWLSLPVPTSKNHLLVPSLLAGTAYQFSVLPQNKLGSGPFSEIASVRTKAVPTEAPPSFNAVPLLDPPTLLTVNRTEGGVLLQWSPPESTSTPLTGYVLQARRDQGHWVILSSNIHANQTVLLVQGLLRDSSYDFRLMSRSNKVLSDPSKAVNVSTIGMDMYPLRPSFMEVIPEPLLAGVLGGICFLFVAIILSLVTACYMAQRRQRRRKRRQGLSSAFPKNTSPQARPPPRSPDSVLKLKLCPPLPFFPMSSSSQSDRSSFDKGSRGEYHDQRRQLLSNSSPPPHYTLFETHLGSQAPSPSALESISRGPDGRFTVQPLLEGSSPSNDNNLEKDVPQPNGGGSSSGSKQTSLRDSPPLSHVSTEKDGRQDSPLTVDIPELSRPSSPGRVRAMAKNISRHGCFYSDEEQGSEALLERASFYSDSSEKKTSDSQRKYRTPLQNDDIFPSLGKRSKILGKDRERAQKLGYQPMESQLTDNSTLVSQLNCESEQDSVSKCVQLAREREELERELESYTANQKSRGTDEGHSVTMEDGQTNPPKSEEEPVWKPQDVTFRQKHRPSAQTCRVSDYRRACYFGNTSSPMDRLPTSHIQWDISPVTSVTNLVPVQSLRETTSSRSQPHCSYKETSEDSLALHSWRSPVTQNTILSPDITSKIPPDRARSLSPPSDIFRRSAAEPDGGAFPRSRHSYAYGGSHAWDSPAKSPLVRSTRPALYNPPERTVDYTATRDSSPSSGSSIPYEHHDMGAKAKDREIQGGLECQNSGFYSEFEKEGVRTRSRRSDKGLFSDSPSPISMLTLVEEVECDQSQLSVHRMSESFKVNPEAPSPKMSPLQTSAILDYLSLPGFIEMSVDEPVEEAEVTETAGQSSGKCLVAKPDVVPKNWEVHFQETQRTTPNQKTTFFEQTHSGVDPEPSSGKRGFKSSLHVDRRDPPLRVRFPDESRPSSPGPEKTSKQLYDEKRQMHGWKKSQEGLGSRFAAPSPHHLLSAARGMAELVSKHSWSSAESNKYSSEQSQRQAFQGRRPNNIATRINQLPMPFLKKSISLGPSRTMSGMGQARPFLKKSISLGSQRWEHFETPRPYISERCYWDEFHNPDVMVRDYSLGRTPSPLPRPGHSWREYVPFRRPSIESLDVTHHPHRSLASSTYLTPAMYPPRQTSDSPLLEPVDLRRQAAIFPESSRWSPSYEETLRSAQHKYFPMPPSTTVPHYQHWPGYRGETMRLMEPRRGPPRSYLPRGISWPSPYYPGQPLREGECSRQPERLMGRGGETEIREGLRASYASQSSGRGSTGLFHRSLSITPTLLSSPETTEESERRRAELELPKRRMKRKNTSVDESYEWDAADACVDTEVLDNSRSDRSQVSSQRRRTELRHDRPAYVQDRHHKDPPLTPRSPLSRSFSEARFNALRQEFHEYRRTQDSTCPQPGLYDSDSDSHSALL